MKLRDYQKEAIQTVANQHKNGISRQLIVLPTGTGKTILMAAMARRFRRKTLILAHREELIQQAKETLLRFWPEADIGICKASKNELNHKIVIGSIQTCCQPKRLKQLKKKGFSLLVIDEAHHAPAASYQKVIKKLGFKSNSKKLLIGPHADKKRLDRCFSCSEKAMLKVVEIYLRSDCVKNQAILSIHLALLDNIASSTTAILLITATRAFFLGFPRLTSLS